MININNKKECITKRNGENNMAGFLVDVETGNPVLDIETGNLIPVDDETAVRQIIFMLLNCQPGSEILHDHYGFDIETALRLSYMDESEMFIESLLADALDPKKEKLISNVNFINVVRDETNPRKVNVTINLDTITGENITILEMIGD